MTDPIIPRKWMLRAHEQHNVFVWGGRERSVHTLMKAFLWALYLPRYPHISVEVRIGDRYKPDVVAYAGDEIAPVGVFTVKQEPLFWGEAGEVGRAKIQALVRRYKHTHFAVAKWNTRLSSVEKTVRDAVADVKRDAPFDLLTFPPDSHTRFIDDDGNITLSHDDIEWLRIE
ncbi:MAG: hypothetical protein RLP44_12745 [Aggregatilineales bacterium]